MRQNHRRRGALRLVDVPAALRGRAYSAPFVSGRHDAGVAGARAGRVRERSQGALRAASVAFRGALEPWCPEIF